MSSHSSPSTLTPASSNEQPSDILTPTRKVQALLAAFDDSDSDADTPATPETNALLPQNQHILTGPPVDDSSEEEEALQPARRSRIAARLQDTGSAQKQLSSDEGDGTVKNPLSTTPSTPETDDLPTTRPMRRRLLTNRKTNTEPNPNRSARSASPLFFPSPLASRQDAERGNDADPDIRTSESGNSKGTSKFLTLVEKHRKRRIEKAAEEAAKRAVKPRQQRGSSPADDTDEDSDLSGHGDGKKLSTQARPTRKASKKAIEEMNRETQRMNRNMQLAHQARTKKKITKDSLLARFNFPMTNSNMISNTVNQSSNSSSVSGSDTEGKESHETPPTSPVQVGSPEKSGKAPSVGVPLHLGLQAEVYVDNVENVNKGKGRAISEDPFQQSIPTFVSSTLNEPTGQSIVPKATIKPALKDRLSIRKTLETEESDSDLEIVTARGDKRKYAAFEQLPKRKAKEYPSHIALRSLAHLMGDRRQSMNTAEMEDLLRQAARDQARQERQEKIAELKAKGVMIQTSEERERQQQEVEDILERARQEAAEIQKREIAQAKKDGNYSADKLDDDDEDDDYEGSQSEEELDEAFEASGESEEDQVDEEENGEDEDNDENRAQGGLESLVEAEASEHDSEDSSEDAHEQDTHMDANTISSVATALPIARKSRMSRVVSDDEEVEGLENVLRSPQLPAPTKTPQSILRSGRKHIPGLQMSDDLPIGLTQAFAATMADSQSQDMDESPHQDSLAMTMDLPSPNITMAPQFQRLDSIDFITDSQPASQTQPLNVDLSFSQSQRVPPSPAMVFGLAATQYTPSQPQFEPTQDEGYILSPFAGNRFASETPQHQAPHSTLDTLVLPADVENSPLVQRKSRLQRGRIDFSDSDVEDEQLDKSAFDVMRRAAKRKTFESFDKSKSHAKNIVDEAAEESEDEYAGLGGASDEDVNEEENDHDREMIDEDTQVGVGDESKFARLFADRERQQDEAAVSKLMKDITTGGLRRKRGNDLDLSDEEDASVRRREAKRREFAKMRRELLKDEAVGKIAEDKKKEAFLRSIEDRDLSDDDGGDLNQSEVSPGEESQEKESQIRAEYEPGVPEGEADEFEKTRLVDSSGPLTVAAPTKLNQVKRTLVRIVKPSSQRPATLAEIRESVSILIDDPESQSGTIDLGLSDSDEEPEVYVNLDRHLDTAEADENALDGEDLGDFIVDDDEQAPEDAAFKKPAIPSTENRAPFSERRTKERANVVDRRSLIRQSSSSSSSSASTKMAFYGSNSSAGTSFGKVPSLLRRATTNSSLGSLSGKNENVSATGVVTNKTERGSANEDKEFVRKGNGGRRNAVNYRPTMREEKMSERSGIAKAKKAAKKSKKASGFLGGLFKEDSWA
ncbi:hypothetical protein LTR84_011674 [Exophiala bonariae]|uniref:DNA replication checkpoint mediator MRC1 domain-containing protein n=1 Tax=Exophiala bonariae TaxID=1690606 RepID=A0AAV9NGV0_9EURO|nr:hypothetical protein LTR84_011674 [Exophiala bonariae]